MEVEVEEQVDDELGLFLLSLVQGEEVSLSLVHGEEVSLSLVQGEEVSLSLVQGEEVSLVQGEEVSLDQGEEGDCTEVVDVSTSNTLKGFKNTFPELVIFKICSHLVFLSPDLLWFKN